MFAMLRMNSANETNLCVLHDVCFVCVVQVLLLLD